MVDIIYEKQCVAVIGQEQQAVLQEYRAAGKLVIRMLARSLDARRKRSLIVAYVYTDVT